MAKRVDFLIFSPYTHVQNENNGKQLMITCFIYDVFQLKVMLLYVDVNIDLVFCSQKKKEKLKAQNQNFDNV